MSTLPSAVLDLSVWKLTLPSGTKGHPTELTQKQLVTYAGGPYCSVNAAGNGVCFSAPVNGVTTSGSSYPRSELREMTAAGKNASWTAKTGWHVLTVVESFDHLPLVKPHLVGAQIHDADKDWTVFRLEGSKLYVTAADNTHFHLVTDSYVLGTPYVAQYMVAANKISAYYNGVLQTTLDAKKLKGAYFKNGAYTQANCTNSSPCSATNYGQTTVYSVSVIHADKPGVLPVPLVPGSAPGPIPTPVPVPVPTPVPVPVPTPGTGDVVMIIRHGEKPSDPNSHILSPVGFARAQALATLFTATPLRAGLSRPDRIYASEGTTASLRPFQTVKPLADKLSEVEITKWAAADYKAAGQEIAKLHGVTLVAWSHAELPGLCKAFGVKTPSSWPDDRFDILWVFSRTATGWVFSQIPQMVLPGDLSKAI